MGWYTKEQLDEDDAILLEHEVDGRKKAAYLEWLALEGERIKENRVLMLGEDREAHCRRDYFSRIEVTYVSLCLSVFVDITFRFPEINPNHSPYPPHIY